MRTPTYPNRHDPNRHDPNRHDPNRDNPNRHDPNRDNRNRSKSRTWLVGVVIAGVAAVGLPAIAVAGSAPSDPATGSEANPALQERIDELCARLPNLQTRTNNLIVRLESDADTRGSLAWLTAQVNRARDNGRNDLAVVLENRLAVRTATLDVLKLRVDSLTEIAVFCDGRPV